MKIDPITGELLDEDNEGQDGQDTPTSEPDTTAPTLAAVSLAVVSAIDKDALIAKVAERQLTKRLAVVVDGVLDSLDFSTYTESIKETALAQLSAEGTPAAAPAVVAPPAPPSLPLLCRRRPPTSQKICMRTFTRSSPLNCTRSM